MLVTQWMLLFSVHMFIGVSVKLPLVVCLLVCTYDLCTVRVYIKENLCMFACYCTELCEWKILNEWQTCRRQVLNTDYTSYCVGVPTTILYINTRGNLQERRKCSSSVVNSRCSNVNLATFITTVSSCCCFAAPYVHRCADYDTCKR